MRQALIVRTLRWNGIQNPSIGKRSQLRHGQIDKVSVAMTFVIGLCAVGVIVGLTKSLRSPIANSHNQRQHLSKEIDSTNSLLGHSNRAKESVSALRVSSRNPSTNPPGVQIVSTSRDDDIPPEVTPRPDTHVVQASGFNGAPYGIGTFEVILSDEKAAIALPDQLVYVFDEEDRVFAGVAKREYVSSNEGKPDWHQPIAILTGYFLYRGSAPFELQIMGPNGGIATASVETSKDEIKWIQSRDAWWEQICDKHYSDAISMEIHNSLMESLATRMHLDYEARTQFKHEDPGAELERSFERTISTLLGVDSLLLAMDSHSNYVPIIREESANRSLPSPFRMAAVPVPSYRPSSIEPIASYVPEECYYVRCSSFDDLVWLRTFLTSWGGSLTEIVSQSSWDYAVRDKIEAQLALSLSDSEQQEVEQSISDLAIIGTDLSFVDGPGIGVILEAKDNEELASLLAQQRRRALSNTPGASANHVDVNGKKVSLLSTDDNRVLSYYAQYGNYHLITNCKTIVERFSESARGVRSLADLNEFKYARSRIAENESSDTYIYLSDPFFRYLASPSFHIESQRRVRANRELTHVSLGRHLAQADEFTGATLQELKDNSYVSQFVGERSDQSQPIILRDGTVIDSKRGARGAFLPVPDVSVERSNAQEIASYSRFISKYRRQWRRVDPITVAFNRRGQQDSGLEEVDIKIWVTPYARERYAFFDQYLATNQEEISVEDDLLSLTASLKDESGGADLVRIGLRDTTVPFSIEEGQIVRAGDYEIQSFSERNQYALTEANKTGALRRIQEFIFSIDSDREVTDPTRESGIESTTILAFTPIGWTYGALSVMSKGLSLLKASGAVQTDDRWTVFGPNGEIREDILGRAIEQKVPSNLMRFHLADVSKSEAGPYIRAYTYMTSLESSRETAEILNSISTIFPGESSNAPVIAGQATGALPLCVLEGQYSYSDDNPHWGWKSTKWTSSSSHQLDSIPPDYQFAFLSWLRNLDVLFELDQQTLHAQISMVVAPGAEDVRGETRNSVDLVSNSNPVARYESVDDVPTVGETLYANSAEASIHLGSERIQTLRYGEELQVITVKEDWIGVVRRHSDGSTQRGWVRKRNLGRMR